MVGCRVKEGEAIGAVGGVIIGVGILVLFCFLGDPNALGPGHVVCRSGGAVTFDGQVTDALAPGGMSESRRYDWRLSTEVGSVHITGDCVHTPAAEHP